MDADALAARASALLEGTEQWRRTAGQTVGFNENEPERRPGFGLLRVTFRNRGRGGGSRRHEGHADAERQHGTPPAFGRFAYGGVAGVFQSRGHALGEATRFRLWVELAFPRVADVVPLMSAEGQRVPKREGDRERIADTRAQNQAGAARVEQRRLARRALGRAEPCGWTRARRRTFSWRQGLTLVHFSAQPEPFLDTGYLSPPRLSHRQCETLSRKVDECKPLVGGHVRRRREADHDVSRPPPW